MAVTMIDRGQIEAATQRYDERRRRRERNEKLIQERRWLEVDSPERVRQFLARRTGAETAEEPFTQGPAAPAPRGAARRSPRSRPSSA
jgi:hypothetical protein